jgi:hypothetical protein
MPSEAEAVCRTAEALLSTVNEETHLLWANPSLVLACARALAYSLAF